MTALQLQESRTCDHIKLMFLLILTIEGICNYQNRLSCSNDGKCLHGLTVACCTTDHYHPCSNLGVGLSEGCFIFDFDSLPLEVAQPI